jgi:hypothetical protein
VTIAIGMFAKPSAPARARIVAAAERYAAFLGLEAKIVFESARK